MAKTYKRNSRGRMSWVVSERPWFSQLISLMVVCFGLLIEHVISSLKNTRVALNDKFDLVFYVLVGVGLVVFFGVTFYRILKFIKELKKFGCMSDWVSAKRAVRDVEYGLLSAGLVRKTMTETIVKVPTCSITEGDQSTFLTVEKLPSVSDVEKVAVAINSSLRRGKLANYAVTEPIETPDGLFYIFELNDVSRDLTFVPEKVMDLVPSDPYCFHLMEGVDWSFVSQPHAIISGLTGSHKTTTMMSLMAQALAVGAEVYIIDFKREMTGFKTFLGSVCNSGGTWGVK